MLLLTLNRVLLATETLGSVVVYAGASRRRRSQPSCLLGLPRLIIQLSRPPCIPDDGDGNNYDDYHPNNNIFRRILADVCPHDELKMDGDV